jgi:hypothetical protein
MYDALALASKVGIFTWLAIPVIWTEQGCRS